MRDLTDAQRRLGLMFPIPASLVQTGECLVPAELSWRRAEIIRKRGWATVNPFHQRWLGKLSLTPAGRRALSDAQTGGRADA